MDLSSASRLTSARSGLAFLRESDFQPGRFFFVRMFHFEACSRVGSASAMLFVHLNDSAIFLPSSSSKPLWQTGREAIQQFIQQQQQPTISNDFLYYLPIHELTNKGAFTLPTAGLTFFYFSPDLNPALLDFFRSRNSF